jgi:hypothetical protein
LSPESFTLLLDISVRLDVYTEQVDIAVTFLTYIPEVLVSNLSQDTGYPD